MDDPLIKFILLVWWVHGIIVAQGFWLTLFSVFIPLVSWVVSGSWLLERFFP